MNKAWKKAISAKVSVIQAASSRTAAITSIMIPCFHVLVVTLATARSISSRVEKNSFSCSLVSASTVAMDFSACTFCPPDSQTGAQQEARDSGSRGGMHRVIMHGLDCATARMKNTCLDLSSYLL